VDDCLLDDWLLNGMATFGSWLGFDTWHEQAFAKENASRKRHTSPDFQILWIGKNNVAGRLKQPAGQCGLVIL
jgi:hypothetical protein